MKTFISLCMFLVATFMLNANDIVISSSDIWEPSSSLSIAEGDKIIVEDGGELTINYLTAPNVDIEVQSGGKCIIQAISEMTGKVITIKLGGILNIEPASDEPIVIGHIIDFEAFKFPNALADSNISELLALLSVTFSEFNILNKGNYPPIAFNGATNLQPGCILNITYPADNTNTLTFKELNINMAAIPTEFIPFIVGRLPAEYQSYSSLLTPGVIPPVIKYTDNAKFPVITELNMSVNILQIVVNFSDNPFPLAPEMSYRLAANSYGIPANDSYLNTTIDLESYSRAAPSSFEEDIPFSITVPVDGSYTIKFPAITPTGNKTWWFYAGGSKEIDLSSTDRAYEVTYAMAGTYSDFLFVRESIPLSLTDIHADSEIRYMEYFTIAGSKVQKPKTGLYIVKVTYADGKQETKKVFLDD